jgi:hypothetical protein
MKLALSLPGPFRLDVSLGLAFLLMLLQLLTGTSLEFAELTFLATVCSILAVNFAGGLKTVAGACIAIIAVKIFLVAEFAKVLFREPGQYRLQEPIITMGVMALSMAALAFAALVCVPFHPKLRILPRTTDPNSLRVIAILSFVIGTGSFFAAQILGINDEGAVYLGGGSGILRRVSACAPLAIIAGTAHALVTSDGKRIFGLYNALPFCAQFLIGVLFTSKQAMLEPFFYLALTATAFRFAWRWLHLVGGILVLVLTLFVLFPFGQVTRNYTRGANLRETYRKTVDFFAENVRRPHFLVEQYQEYTEGVEEGDADRYFNKPNGFLERMALIKPADSLIAATLSKGTSGWDTIGPGLEDLVPRKLLPRPYVNVPNNLGNKADVLTDDDFNTCVSFGFAADAFSSFGWTGVAVISFGIGILLIVVTRALVDGIEHNIWALVLVGAYQIGIAEAPVGGVLQGILYQNAWTVAALLAIRFLAFFSNRYNRRIALKALYDAFTARSTSRRQLVG